MRHSRAVGRVSSETSPGECLLIVHGVSTRQGVMLGREWEKPLHSIPRHVLAGARFVIEAERPGALALRDRVTRPVTGRPCGAIKRDRDEAKRGTGIG